MKYGQDEGYPVLQMVDQRLDPIFISRKEASYRDTHLFGNCLSFHREGAPVVYLDVREDSSHLDSAYTSDMDISRQFPFVERDRKDTTMFDRA